MTTDRSRTLGRSRRQAGTIPPGPHELPGGAGITRAESEKERRTRQHQSPRPRPRDPPAWDRRTRTLDGLLAQAHARTRGIHEERSHAIERSQLLHRYDRVLNRLRRQAEEDFAAMVRVRQAERMRLLAVRVRVVSRVESVAIQALFMILEPRHDVHVQRVPIVRVQHESSSRSRQDRHQANEHPQPDTAASSSHRSRADGRHRGLDRTPAPARCRARGTDVVVRVPSDGACSEMKRGADAAAPLSPPGLPRAAVRAFAADMLPR